MKDKNQLGLLGEFICELMFGRRAPMPDFDAAEDHIRFCSCDKCGQYLPLLLAIIVEKITNRKHIKLHFCSETCANEYYLEKLREGGL